MQDMQTILVQKGLGSQKYTKMLVRERFSCFPLLLERPLAVTTLMLLCSCQTCCEPSTESHHVKNEYTSLSHSIETMKSSTYQQYSMQSKSGTFTHCLSNSKLMKSCICRCQVSIKKSFYFPTWF